MKKRKIAWDKQALNNFREAIRYIRKDSPQDADKVKKEVIEKIDELSKRPEIHNPDNTRSTIAAITGPSNYTVYEWAIS